MAAQVKQPRPGEDFKLERLELDISFNPGKSLH